MMKRFLWVILGTSLVLAGCSQPLEGTGSGRDFNTVPATGITSFAVGGVKGEIEGTTIYVRDVPLYTVEHTLTDLRNAVPIIGYKGGTLTPTADTPRDFSTPKIYTLLTDDGVQLDYTVVVTVRPLSSAAEIEAYFPIAAGVYAGTEAEPLPVPVGMALSAKAWREILTVVQNGGKYVALDLSACTASPDMAGGGLYGDRTFDPGPTHTGESKVVSLVLPDEAERIVGGEVSAVVFKRYTVLGSVTGAGIKDVGHYAFSGCDALTMISFPAVTSISYDAFSGCDGLITVSLPAAASIGEAAFYDCAALTTISLSAATSIGNEAFSACTNLSSVYLPVAASIGNNAFSYCDALRELDLFTAKFIGTEAFSGCTGLTTVSLSSATNIGSNAFSDCDTLTTVYLPAATSIGNYAFNGCDALTTIDLPAAINIGNYAFYGCDALSSVSFRVARTIGDNAFNGCTSLTTVSFQQARTIGAAVFNGCTALTSVDFPEVVSIGTTAFYGCPLLASVSLPSVRTIGNYAFSLCSVLSSVSLPAARTIGTSVFSDCTALTTAVLPMAKTIGAYVFNGCTSLTTVDLSSATNIDTAVFGSTGTETLTVTLGTSLPELGVNIFNTVTSAKAVTVKVPSGATGYGTPRTVSGPISDPPSWADGFRGKGWDGISFISGTHNVNSYITLTIVEYTP
jgi:hypothetical protein